MKVGPKGQVVIPRVMRKALKIEPGSKVVFTLQDNSLSLKKPNLDAVAVFEKVAKEIHYNRQIDLHAYEEELDERFKLALSRR